jgi:hypothetical protein
MPLDAEFNFFAFKIFWLFYYVIKLQKYLFIPVLFGNNEKWSVWKNFNTCVLWH